VTVIRHSLSPSQNAPSRSLNASPVAVTAWARASSGLWELNAFGVGLIYTVMDVKEVAGHAGECA
jgi:hypothetical protein